MVESIEEALKNYEKEHMSSETLAEYICRTLDISKDSKELEESFEKGYEEGYADGYSEGSFDTLD